MSWHQDFSRSSKISVHDLDSSKISFILEMIRTHDFHHPVQHSCSENSINFMVAQKATFYQIFPESIFHLRPIHFAIFFGLCYLLSWRLWEQFMFPVRMDLLNWFCAEWVNHRHWLEILFHALRMLEWQLNAVKRRQQVSTFVNILLLILFLIDRLNSSCASIHYYL